MFALFWMEYFGWNILDGIFTGPHRKCEIYGVLISELWNFLNAVATKRSGLENLKHIIEYKISERIKNCHFK